MVFRFNLIYLVAAALFFHLAYRQFYLHRNVDQLERDGKLTPDAAARIRRKPMKLIGWMGIIGGIGLLAKAFFQF